MTIASFKLALAQMYIAPGERERNLERAVQFIRNAAKAGAGMILLPEALPFGWMDPSARDEAEEIPTGSACQMLSQAAVETGIFVCAGLVEREGNRIYNSAVLIDPKGETVLHHRKVNELAIAHELYALGDRVRVVDTALGRIGLMICADAFVPGQAISRSLGMMGAQIIVSPCAWAVPPAHDNDKTPYGKLWQDNYCPVAREYGMWIAGCSNVGPIASGPWAGHRCIGSSLVIGPNGEVRVRGSFGAEEMLLVEIRPQRVSRIEG